VFSFFLALLSDLVNTFMANVFFPCQVSQGSILHHNLFLEINFLRLGIYSPVSSFSFTFDVSVWAFDNTSA
jgi:hypothetical protein